MKSSFFYNLMKKGKLDELNIKLLKALEEDSRRSLKELAVDLNIKTSTIYHRLHRLKECKVLEGFSIIVNPDEMNLSVFNFLTISLRNLNVIRLDKMFVESFAQYLASEFNEILFESISETKIYVISCHPTAGASEEFLEKIRAIPYVDNVDKIQFDKIIKGHRMFAFNPDYFDKPVHAEETIEESDEKSAFPQDFDIDDPDPDT